MSTLNVRADTELREQAVAAVDTLAGEHGFPVSKTQIAGLRQIATNEPSKLSGFADSQKTRAEKRGHTDEVAFWDLVKNLGSEGKSKLPWSLTQARDQSMPPELEVPKLEQGENLSGEEQAARKKKKRRLKSWQDQWRDEHYPAFFRCFCAHYLYRMPPER